MRSSPAPRFPCGRWAPDSSPSSPSRRRSPGVSAPCRASSCCWRSARPYCTRSSGSDSTARRRRRQRVWTPRSWPGPPGWCAGRPSRRSAPPRRNGSSPTPGWTQSVRAGRAARARLTRPTNRRAPWRRPPPGPRCRRCRRCRCCSATFSRPPPPDGCCAAGRRAAAPPAPLGARSGPRGARLPARGPGARTRPAGGSPGHVPRGAARTAGHGVRATGRARDRSSALGRPARSAGPRGSRPRRLTRRTTSGRITPGVPSCGTRACPLFRTRNPVLPPNQC